MAVPTTQLEVRYEGNGSTVAPYPIPFPFHDAAHIYAAVSPDGVADAVLLSPSAYRVTQLADGSGGSLTTVAAVTAPAKITIFRELPLTQPTVFQPAGPFPAKSNETALDRLLMQIQQLNRRLSMLGGTPAPGGGSGDSTRSVLTWAAPADRGTVKPSWAGQLGVERSTQTIWIAQSATVGDWKEFRPRRTGRLVIGLVADAGLPSADQTAVANRLDDWNCDAVLFAGDNNYSPPDGNYYGTPNYDADWAAFAAWITAGKAFPALGSHDVDYDGWEARHVAKFTYLPGNKRYYQVTLGNGLVDVFVLHSGFNSIRELVEPDGNTVGSVQHQWFASALAASRARWKIAVFHFPPATLRTEDGRAAVEMAWPELSRCDLICCGHAHMMEVLRWSETMLVNVSAVAHDDGTAGAVLQGSVSPVDRALWADDEPRGLGRIVATEERLEIEVWRSDGVLLHGRNVEDFSPLPEVREQWNIIAPADAVGVFAARFFGVLCAPTMLRRVMVSVAEEGTTPLVWTLNAGDVVVASGTLAAGQKSQLVASLVPLEMIPRGAQLYFTAAAAEGSGDPDALGLNVTILAGRYS